MNKKGFTLIELLAVIVILAVIALITTPLITNTINTSRKNADRESARSYISIIETKITEAILEYPNIEIGSKLETSTKNDMYTWSCSNCDDSNKIKIDFKGTAPQKVSLTYDQNDGKIRGLLKYANGCWKVDDKGNLQDIKDSTNKDYQNFCK